MKVVVIHGQSHKGSTYHAAQMLADKIGGETRHFFLPRDFKENCVGCARCFMEDEHKCPHYEALHEITEALDAADVIILASPVYAYHCTGAMKSLLDHYGYRWMIHRPEPSMFFKQAVTISTAAGSGTKSTNKDMADSLSFWGISAIYRLGYVVSATRWENVPEKKRAKIERDTDALARRIRSHEGRIMPSLKTKLMFHVMRMINLKMNDNPADIEYYRKMGWGKAARPWKK